MHGVGVSHGYNMFGATGNCFSGKRPHDAGYQCSTAFLGSLGVQGIRPAGPGLGRKLLSHGRYPKVPTMEVRLNYSGKKARFRGGGERRSTDDAATARLM